MQDLPVNHFRVSGASWVNIIHSFIHFFVSVLKLVKLAKGVRSLLDTLFEALPQVTFLINHSVLVLQETQTMHCLILTNHNDR